MKKKTGVRPGTTDAMKGTDRPGLVNVDDKIDAVGKAALKEARRREVLDKAKRDAALRKPPHTS